MTAILHRTSRYPSRSRAGRQVLTREQENACIYYAAHEPSSLACDEQELLYISSGNDAGSLVRPFAWTGSHETSVSRGATHYIIRVLFFLLISRAYPFLHTHTAVYAKLQPGPKSNGYLEPLRAYPLFYIIPPIVPASLVLENIHQGTASPRWTPPIRSCTQGVG